MSDQSEPTSGSATNGSAADESAGGGRDDHVERATGTADVGADDADSDGWTFEVVGEQGDDADTDAEPLRDLADRVDERRDTEARENDSRGAFDELDDAWTGEGAVPSDADELFEEMDVANVDTEALWDSVLSDDDGDPIDFEADGVGAPAGNDGSWGAAFEADDEQQEVIVPKNSHCESCYFFTSPPEAACTYDGSEVVEIVDSEQFLVSGCPVVAGVVNTDGTPVGEGDGLAAETSD